jgi:signal transduction histidine kinase
MTEFFLWTRDAQLLITLLIAVCVLGQALALALSYYRRSRSRIHYLEAVLELFVLLQIIVLSLLHGQVFHGYDMSLIAPTGYGALRYIAAATVALSGLLIIVVTKRASPLAAIAAICLTLPFVEGLAGGAYAWLHTAVLMFWLLRSVCICIVRYRKISTGISALSVKYAIDSLHSGLLFSEPDGLILLVNTRMQNLMSKLTGSIHRNALHFFDALTSGELCDGCRSAQYEGQVVCLLPDQTAWMFTRTQLQIRNKPHIQLAAADITELWALTEQLQQQEDQLKQRSEELRETIANLHILSREKELQNAKTRAHDVLGGRLTLLLHTIRNEQTLSIDLLRSQTQSLLDDLRSIQSTASPQEKFANLQQTFEIIGVEIYLEGALPEDETKSDLFVDIISEGVANAVRHGYATTVAVRLWHSNHGWHMEITDNGRPPALPVAAGGGISGIRKKLEPHGGRLELTARPRYVLAVDIPGGETDV